MKERLVICNEEDTDGRARVTRDEERVLTGLTWICREIPREFDLTSVQGHPRS